MNELELKKKMKELEQKISQLPPGGISTKKINGKVYFYHRITKDQKRVETYIDFDHVDILREGIQTRKSLEKELKQLKRMLVIKQSKPVLLPDEMFSTYVRTGTQLQRLAEPVRKYKKRECYSVLSDFIFGEQQDKVFILYGLRRTGKTTLIRQILLDMTPEQLEKTAFMQMKSTDTLSQVNRDLKQLEQMGYAYVFIDEVTLMEDFIEGAALFSDIYASSGMKIVLSGTDSLGFVFTKSDQLYDRCILLHTTFIPYREFENVLGIKGIDEYIQYGGTMSMSGVNYNEVSSFVSDKSTSEYIDSAIAWNIQHSLKYYQDGRHFRHLYALYEQKELTSAINRVVEDMNHRFTKEVLTRTFKSGDLSVSARNLLHDLETPIDLLENIDRDGVTKTLMSMLDILNKDQQSVLVDETHAYQIREYLLLLDLIMEIDLRYLPNVNQHDKVTVICQPGLRYAQAKALIDSLLLDKTFSRLSLQERHRISERILSEIKGRMMEDIVLLETKLANPHKQVFKLQFAVGEFDMVIHDPVALSCEVFEIKHSSERVPAQYKYLIDTEKCADTEHRFGPITNKTVIYRGETVTDNRIPYLNVEEYLKSL